MTSNDDNESDHESNSYSENFEITIDHILSLNIQNDKDMLDYQYLFEYDYEDSVFYYILDTIIENNYIKSFKHLLDENYDNIYSIINYYYNHCKNRDGFKDMIKNYEYVINFEFNSRNILKFLNDVYDGFNFDHLFELDEQDEFDYLVNHTNFDPYMINAKKRNILFYIQDVELFEYVYNYLNDTSMINQIDIDGKSILSAYHYLGSENEICLNYIKMLIKYNFNLNLLVDTFTTNCFLHAIFLANFEGSNETIDLILAQDLSQIMLKHIWVTLLESSYHRHYLNQVYDRIKSFDHADITVDNIGDFVRQCTLENFKLLLDKYQFKSKHMGFESIITNIRNYDIFMYVYNNYVNDDMFCTQYLFIKLSSIRRMNKNESYHKILKFVCAQVGQFNIQPLPKYQKYKKLYPDLDCMSVCKQFMDATLLGIVGPYLVDE